MAETKSSVGTSSPPKERRPRLKTVAIKTEFHQVFKDPAFTERLKGKPSEYYSYYISFFKPGSYDKQSYKTNNILKKFAAEGIIEEYSNDSKESKGSKDSKESTCFYELSEEYNGAFNLVTKPFLVDAATWKVFMEPHTIAEIKRQAGIVLENFKRNNNARKKTKVNREALHFETSSEALEIVLTISTKFLNKSKINRNEANILMLQLSYEFQKDAKTGGLGKLAVPLDLFLLYLEKEAEQFYLSCSENQLGEVPEAPEEEVKTTQKATKRKLSSEPKPEIPKRQRQLSSESSSGAD